MSVTNKSLERALANNQAPEILETLELILAKADAAAPPLARNAAAYTLQHLADRLIDLEKRADFARERSLTAVYEALILQVVLEVQSKKRCCMHHAGGHGDDLHAAFECVLVGQKEFATHEDCDYPEIFKAACARLRARKAPHA